MWGTWVVWGCSGERMQQGRKGYGKGRWGVLRPSAAGFTRPQYRFSNFTWGAHQRREVCQQKKLSEPPLISICTQHSDFISFYHTPLWPPIQITSVNRCEKVDYSSQIHNLFHSMFFLWSLLQKWKWKSTSDLKLRMVPSKCQGHKLRFSGGKIGSRKGLVKTKMYLSQRECVWKGSD